MIADLEQRLAEVIGAALPAPFTGTTAVAPGPAAGPDPALVLGTTTVNPLAPDFGSDSRPEQPPSVADPLRVVRASCTLLIEIRPGAGQGRAQQLAGLDALLYLLDGPEFRSGTALGDGTDHGFVLDSMRVLDARTQPDPATPSEPPVVLNLVAQGWFWPPGTPGTAGAPAVEIRLRGVDLPLSANVPRLVAGAPATTLDLSLPVTGPLRLHSPDGPALPELPFGSLALRLAGPGDKPGAGALSGGTAGADGVIFVPVTADRSSVQYTPPAAPARDTLVVALDDGTNGVGAELARVTLLVTSS